MDLKSLTNVVIPPWGKYVAYSVLATVVVGFIWGHGFISGIERTNDRQQVADLKVVKVQGKVTTRIITKYVEAQKKQTKIDEEIKNEGQGYAIKFPDDYVFNNEYVRLYNNSVTGQVSTLSSGDPEGASGVTTSDSLEVGIHNNIVARDWQHRALTCEAWTKAQEEASQ